MTDVTVPSRLRRGEPVTEARKLVSILFADLTRSLAMIRGRDPEEARALLEPELDAMAASVARFGGTVVQRLGDGIMAAFGVPQALEDHAARAALAALAMRDAPHPSRGVLRIGLHAGEVLVHAAGAGGRDALHLVGEAVHIAARMQQAARPGTIRATATLLRLAGPRFRATPQGATRVKGLDAPIETAELEGETGAAPLASRPRTPLLGREAERGRLAAALDAAARGHAACLLIIGEAGAGKSRLAQEAASDAAARGFAVQATGCDPHAGDSGLQPFADLCRRLFGPDPAGLPKAIAARLARGETPPGEIARAAPALAAVAGAPPDSAWRAMQPAARRRAILAALVTLFAAEARAAPVLPLFENLHWADAETRAALGAITAALPDARLLVLGTTRPDDAAEERLPPHESLVLPPLREAEAATLVHGLLGEAADPRLVARIVERAGGNPFFAEELALSVLERGGGAAEAALPDSVRGVLASRLDRLDPADREALEAASVLGVEIDPVALAALLGRPMEETLARAEAARFLARHGNALCFRHALTRDAAYAGMPRARRRALHAAALEVLERLYPGSPELLAWHAERAQRPDALVRHAREAAARAAARSANRAAVGFLETALGAAEGAPETAESLALRVDLRFALRDALFRLGRVGEVASRLDEASALAGRLGNRARRAQLVLHLSHARWIRGDHAGAARAAAEAAAMAAHDADAALALRARFQAGLAAFGTGEYAAAAHEMRAVAEGLDAAPDLTGQYGLDLGLQATAMSYAARALAERGDPEAAAAARAAERYAVAHGKPFSVLFAALGVGAAALSQGRAQEALEAADHAARLCAEAEAELMQPVVDALLGAARLAAGAADAAGPLARAVAAAEATGFLMQQPHRMSLLAEARLREGDRAEATRLAGAARRLAQRQGDRGGAAMAERAWALAAESEAAVARRLARAAALAEAAGMAPLAAACRAPHAPS
ncbi:MAG TPA: BREX system ATP-binding domain-containing protein [Acetobacteraceae bacterium]|nr:BREX system ATP-binding domain-containing protein [Acetobacteraceae bacterium]